MAEKVYVVKEFDAEGVTLQQTLFHFLTVRIPRQQIASVREGFGFTFVETTGHLRYKIRQGYRAEQRNLTREALA
jgi:hypothetical protein